MLHPKISPLVHPPGAYMQCFLCAVAFLLARMRGPFLALAVVFLASSAFAQNGYDSYTAGTPTAATHVGYTTINITYTFQGNGCPNGAYYVDTAGEGVDGPNAVVVHVTGGICSPATVVKSFGPSNPTYYSDWLAGQPTNVQTKTWFYTVVTFQSGATVATGSWGYTMTWTGDQHATASNSQNLSVTIPLNGVVNHYSANFPVQAAANDGKSHTITLNYNGTAVSTQTIAAGTKGGTPVLLNTSIPMSDCINGDTYSWTIDGVTGGGGSVYVNDGAPVFTAPTLQAKWAGTAPPSSTPAPTPGPTNAGDTTTTNNNTNLSGAVNTPTTTVNNSNTTISGTSNGATNEDIYNDVYHALMDAGNATAVNTLSPLSASPSYTPPDSSVGLPTSPFGDPNAIAGDIYANWTSIKASLQSSVDNVGSTASALQSMVNVSPFTVPSAGLTFSFPAPTVLFGVDHYTLDISPYHDVIANFRLVCSVSMGLLMYVGTVGIIRGALADQPGK